ncbi:hypothetical protein Pelo_15383 [Pelomyxa schiedti]|nr:hypothetical protein Pelo_15383 [Pelomyxa schiedti]
MSSAAKPIKLVMLGGTGVGKSAITIRFVHDRYDTDYNPTIENSFQKSFNVDSVNHNLEILDTAGTEQFVGTSQPNKTSLLMFCSNERIVYPYWLRVHACVCRELAGFFQIITGGYFPNQITET